MKDYHIGYYVKRISNNFENLKRRNCEKYDITGQQTSILFYLNKNKDSDINQKNIEKFFDLSNATVSGLISRMESRGLVIRVANPNDKRDKHIVLTDKGSETAAAIKKSILTLEQKVVKGFKDEEVKELLSFFERMLTNIKEETND
jgi:DNA-binding MarR family transcriptional regulator